MRRQRRRLAKGRRFASDVPDAPDERQRLAPAPQCAAQQSGWVAGTPEAGEATGSTVDPRGALRLCRVLGVQAAMSVPADGQFAVAKRRDRNAIMPTHDRTRPSQSRTAWNVTLRPAQLTDAHAAASLPPDPAAGANGSASGYFRGRPRGRLRATTTPPTNSSPPQTPQGSRRSSAPARHASRIGQSRHSALASSTSAGDSAKNSSGSASRQGSSRPSQPVWGPPSGRLLRSSSQPSLS